MAATARAAMTANGGDGEGVGLMVRHLAVDARSDGASNVTVVRFGLPAHHRIVDTDALQIVFQVCEPSADEVAFRSMVTGDAASLTRIIYRCYGWSYPNSNFYYPERIAAALESGERIGEVAVTSEGEVAAHWGAVYLSASVAETGGTVADPRFRRRGIADELGERLRARLAEIGVIGRVREPVMTHAAPLRLATQPFGPSHLRTSGSLLLMNRWSEWSLRPATGRGSWLRLAGAQLSPTAARSRPCLSRRIALVRLQS